MRHVALAALLLACSSSAPAPSDGGAGGDSRLPPDDGSAYTFCLGAYQRGCVSPASDPAEHLYTASVAWSCLAVYDVPDAQREAARVCTCAAVGSISPTGMDAAGLRTIRLGCCGRTPALSSAWCPDAG